MLHYHFNEVLTIYRVLAVYLEKLAELHQMLDPSNPNDPIASSISVVEFGIEYERMYIKWCEKYRGK
ncbi:hypothetical protein J7E63_01545 [Bacillus sp. ISL-75]|uniref:hypothetical protein n=1 Tax=Bacillus sp. ISL-75 TaxID=2819137 RepID=UPI001BE63882|nr:hypothetical protein [Bacillus sp. ISL-75]MBT2725622.1 hypothetical protein [Bacillus sp. ISL-75]